MHPTPQSSVAGSRGSTAVKLRSACERCCAAKVKCSGEKTGCDRCKAIGSACVYVESRVGKVPGIRARKKSVPGQSKPRHGSSPSGSSTPSSTEIHAQPSGQDRDEIMRWTNDWDLNPGDTDTIIAAISTESQPSYDSQHTDPAHTQVASSEVLTSFPSGDEYQVPMSLGDFDDLIMTQSSTGCAVAQTQLSQNMQSHGHRSLAPNSQVDSQCVQECCQIITDLEDYIGSGLTAFKIILGIVRQVFGNMDRLIRLQQASRNPRCAMLLITILYQSLVLIEACLVGVASERNKQRRDRLGGTSFGLGFGDLSYDAEEQFAFRTHNLLKEVQHATGMVGKLKVLTDVGPEPVDLSENGVARGKARTDCYRDLEMRLREVTLRFSRDT